MIHPLIPSASGFLNAILSADNLAKLKVPSVLICNASLNSSRECIRNISDSVSSNDNLLLLLDIVLRAGQIPAQLTATLTFIHGKIRHVLLNL